MKSNSFNKAGLYRDVLAAGGVLAVCAGLYQWSGALALIWIGIVLTALAIGLELRSRRQ